jgi:L-ascorbate metabolism protein UlaG (beta-lactamase superfamily)
MEITYLGHSSFRLRGKTATLVTDPFDSKKVGLKFPKVKADIVTVSHDHGDHNDVKAVGDIKRVVDGPGEYEISGVSIIGIPTYHDDKKGEERGKNNVYVIEMDGLRLAHLGDLGHKLSEKTLGKMGDLDILMVPVGGFYTIDAKQAAETVRSIEPSITLPMHFKAKGMAASFDKIATVDSFLTESGLPVEKAKKLSIKRSDIGEEMKVVVLEKR